MGLDQDKIKKRLSQIEIDINQMNQMIDENLQLVESVEDEAVQDDSEKPDVIDTPKAVDMTNTVLLNNTDEAGINSEDIAHTEDQRTSKGDIPVENGTIESAEAPSQSSDTRNVTVEEQVNHTAIAIGDSYNSFVANSAGNEKTKSIHTDNKETDTVNVIQDKSDAYPETVQNNDGEWEDEKPEAEEEYIDREARLNSETKSFEPPTRQNTTFTRNDKADTELVLDKFSSTNNDSDIQSQTISVESNNENDHESNHSANQTPQDETSEDFLNPSGRSTPLDSQSRIFIPKKNSKDDNTKVNDISSGGHEQKKTAYSETRRPTNPFRVISVSSNSNSRGGSRKSSLNKYESPISSPVTSASELGNVAKLEKRHDYLSMKCIKLQKEIDYLNKMNAQGSLSMEDGKRLYRAVVKLQEYLDKKTKEKYEVGVLLSRNLRKQIDRGENGQFWIGTK